MWLPRFDMHWSASALDYRLAANCRYAFNSFPLHLRAFPAVVGEAVFEGAVDEEIDLAV